MTLYQVTIDGKKYQVEIEDVNAQPVEAVVNGHPVQVWVEQSRRQAAPIPDESASPPSAPPQAAPAPSVAPTAAAAQPGAVSDREVRAPMPGTIVSVDVAPGETVEVGQDLCVLDAMKMNNHIRAPRAGTIAQVETELGEQLQYGDLLFVFAE